MATRLLSSCRVDAGGVPAEWIETGPARNGQPTLVYFQGSGQGRAHEAERRSAIAKLAFATGARVFSVGCRSRWEAGCWKSAVDDGLAAYRWLLAEGCDVRTTAFVDEGTTGRAAGVFRAAQRRGLPLPGARWTHGQAPGGRPARSTSSASRV